jgi:membrane protease YdiL (CAAX protease family)
MALFGEDFAGGLFGSRFEGHSPVRTGKSVAIFAVLIVGYLFMQGLVAIAVQKALFGAPPSDSRTLALSAIIGLTPLACLMVPVSVFLSRIDGGTPRYVLNLRVPRLTLLGWIVVVGGFIIGVLAAFMIVLSLLTLFHVDLPGSGMVEQTVAGAATQSGLLALVVPSLIIGAPVAEELLFRGQIFTALSQTRLGFSGTTVLTAAGWAALHYSGQPVQVALIFVLGLILGWLMYRFGSLYVTIACHAAWNGLVSLVVIGNGG